MSLSTSSIIFIPVCLASLTLSAYTAGIVPFPGRAIPRISVRQFIELAVKSPAQLPHPGHEYSSMSLPYFSSFLPTSIAPGASNASVRATAFPFTFPGSMGPPLQKIAGTLSLNAAISIPGTILSQLGINTIPSTG